MIIHISYHLKSYILTIKLLIFPYINYKSLTYHSIYTPIKIKLFLFPNIQLKYIITHSTI